MAGYFSTDDIAQLRQGRQEVQRQFRNLQERYVVRKYTSERAREHAQQGFCRRLDTLARAVDLVFEILPPDREDIPDTDDVVVATMLIQSFVLNASGCLDNLAWIWVYETGLKDKDGKELDPKWVGLGENYWYVRSSFTKPFRKFLRSRKAWLRHLSQFRDSLAHRIPLYIPPYIVSEQSIAAYNKLARESIEAMQRGDRAEYDRLRTEQKKLGRFLPWMTHSQVEGAPTAVFHWQLLQDYVTIDEFGREMLGELDRFDKLRPASADKSTGHGGSFVMPRTWIVTLSIVTIVAALYWIFWT